MIIFLIGYRATGKTSVGKMVAEKLKWNFVDTDALLIEKEGQNIKTIVEKKGWDFFRKKETEIIKSTCKLKNTVVATGGGVVLHKENITNMQQCGKIVLLEASLATIKKRIENDKNSEKNRPPLNKCGNYNLEKEIAKNFKEREPIYKKISDITFNTDKLNEKNVTSKILEYMRN